jgi:peptidase E
MNLHLFSTPGKDDIRYIVDTSRQYLEGKERPVVAYLPAASFADTWEGFTEKAFHGLARVETINTEMMTLPDMEATLRGAALIYIPGGNTFLLNHRLHLSKFMDTLQRKVRAGFPLVAFSAGTVLCGPNILTSRNMNLIGTSYFSGLKVTNFNFYVHYTEDELPASKRTNGLGNIMSFTKTRSSSWQMGDMCGWKGRRRPWCAGMRGSCEKGRKKKS